MLHAINMVPNWGVEMACNTPTSALERKRRPLRALPNGRGQHGVQYAVMFVFKDSRHKIPSAFLFRLLLLMQACTVEGGH